MLPGPNIQGGPERTQTLSIVNIFSIANNMTQAVV